jgi:hypothetical protein
MTSLSVGEWPREVTMRVLSAAVAAVLALAAPGDPAKEYEKLVLDSKSTKLGYKEAYLAFKEKFEAFALANKGTEEAVSAKLWLLRNTWWHREEKTMESRAAALAEEILAEAPKSPQIARIPDFHYDFAPADRVRIFTKILETSPHAAARGSALLRLALGVKGEDRKGMLERLRKEFADVPYRFGTFGELADAHLAPHDPAALEVGKSAPDIVGRDADGKPMKLSDYRGKVVVVDFFGDW